MKPLAATLFGFAIVLAAAPAGSAAPRAQDDAPAKSRWEKLTPEERDHLKENFDHWKKLSPDDRELMKRRHERLEVERKRVDATLQDDDRAALEKMHERERRRELTRRAKEALHERFEQLPPELRERIRGELAKLPPAQREKRVREFVKQHIQREIKEKLGHLVATGKLTREDVEKLHQEIQEQPPLERLETLRRFVVDHAQSLQIAPDVLEHIRGESDAGFGLDLLDRWLRAKKHGGLFHFPRRREFAPPPGPPPGAQPAPPPGPGPHKRV